jgi:hypothetical protein
MALRVPKATPQKPIYRLLSVGNFLRVLVIAWKKALVCIRWWSNGVFAIPSTACFRNSDLRNEHFGWHKIDFGVSTIIEYEIRADRFFAKIKTAGIFECKSNRNVEDTVRYDPVTNEFGVITKNRIIRTYYTPYFCASAPTVKRLAGKCHNRNTHLEYAQSKCSP